LLTDKQTNKQTTAGENITSLAEVTKSHVIIFAALCFKSYSWLLD